MPCNETAMTVFLGDNLRYIDTSGKNEIVVTIQEFLDWMGSEGGAGT